MAVEAARAPTGLHDRGPLLPLVVHAARRIRVTTAIWIGALVLLGAVVVVTYRSAYDTPAERAVLAAQIEGNPSFEALFGPARDIDTVGGFAIWRINGVALLLAAVWAMFATARLTRGEEDAGHTELLAAGALRREGPTLVALLVVGGGAAILGAVVAGALVASGLDPPDAAVVAGAQALLAATFAALTALVAQLVPSRGRTLAVAGGVLAAAYFVRVVSTGADLEWLAWASPLGWGTRLGYAPGITPLLPFAVAVPLLGAAALVLSRRRDLGASALGYGDATVERGGPVRSAASLSRRLVLPAALGWTTGLGAYALLIGLLTRDMLDFLRESPGIVEIAQQLGIDSLDRAEGVLGFGFGVFALGVALVAAQQAAAIREEEATGRLETLLVRPLGRTRWLAGRLVAVSGALLLVSATTGLAAWIGVVARGETVDAWRLAAAAANLLPPALLFLGLALAVFGLRPRATAAAAWGLVLGTFLVEFVGSLLDLPGWLLAVSPFHHLQPAPAVDPAVGAALVMVAAGAAAAAVGVAAFRRRDLAGP
jgi:ABC-2 type transport system permease protein